MAKFLRMPGVSADADTAILSAWSVEAGATVSAGDVLAEVETEKAVVDIEADDDAVIHTLLVEGGATVGVSDPIAVLLEVGEDASAGEELVGQLQGGGAAEGAGAADESPAAPASAGASEVEAHAGDQAVRDAGPGQAPTDLDVPADVIPPETDAAGATPGAQAPGAGADEPSVETERTRIFISPIARKIARENNLDISQVAGTGPNGRIQRKDIEQAIATRATAPAPAPAESAAAAAPPRTSSAVPDAPDSGYTDIPHSRLRRFVASRLQESKQLAPHFYLRGEVRVDKLLALRKEINEAATVRVSVNDFFVKAAARALQDVPDMNVTWSEDFVRQYERSDVAVAIASDKGLVTPVVRGADTQSLSAISARVKDFSARANEGRLQQDELQGGSFTVTNLGMYGTDEFDAIINPPHAGILAVGAAKKKPIVTDDGDIEAATVTALTLSVDHRPVDGVLAAQWFQRLRELLENPFQIVV